MFSGLQMAMSRSSLIDQVLYNQMVGLFERQLQKGHVRLNCVTKLVVLAFRRFTVADSILALGEI